jgi:hypothetical protein
MRARATAVASLLALPIAAQGLSHDVPRRGAHVYTRTTEQFELGGPPTRLRPEWLVLDGSSRTPQEWRYVACTARAVPANFEQPGFDDSSWSTGRGEFAPPANRNPELHTDWHQEVLCLRAATPLGQKKPKALLFVVNHDDSVRIWLNGKLLVADDGVGRGRCYVALGPALDAWQPTGNLLAAKCVNTGGAQYFDVAVGAFYSLPPAVRTADDLQKLMREEREQGERVRRDLFGGFRPPPLLFQGELDDKQQCVAIPPGDLRELGWWLATDLRPNVLGAPVAADAWRMLRLGDLQVRGKAGPVEPDGWQTLELTVKNAPELATRGDSKRFLDHHVRPFVWYGFDGTLRIRRRLEVKEGKARVAEFSTDLDGRIVRGKEGREIVSTLRQRETWRYQATRDNQDAEFRAMVRTAIERGCARIREWLRRNSEGSLAPPGKDATESFNSGRLALGLLALVKGGTANNDDVVQAGFAELRQRKLIDTYSLANAIMALEALYVPGNEYADLRSGLIDRPRRRSPTPGDLALLQRWCAQLLTNLDTRVDPQYLLRFNYTAGDRFDNSVNQYGLLGLHSAHLCGVEIKATVWEAAANHLLAAQTTDGAKIQLEIVDYRTQARRQADPDAYVSAARTNARANGWSYAEPKDQGETAPTWGSMTCAGITGLAICEAGIVDSAQKRPKLLADCRRARDDGFAWLAQNFTVRQHAGAIERQQHWFYYYLYSLERAALLSGIALIQERDWYFEGASVLVLAQAPDGSWPGELEYDQEIERAAMAVLFLKQSTAPVLTGR